MRYAILNDSIIVNIIAADIGFVKTYYPNAIKCPENVGMDDVFLTNSFYRPTFTYSVIDGLTNSFYTNVEIIPVWS